MADDTPTLGDLPPIDWGHWVTEGQAQCSRCQCLVPDQAGHRAGHEDWHAVIESEAISGRRDEIKIAALDVARPTSQPVDSGPITAQLRRQAETIAEQQVELSLLRQQLAFVRDQRGPDDAQLLAAARREIERLRGELGRWLDSGLSQGETDRLRRIEDALIELGAPNASTKDDPGGPMIAWIRALADPTRLDDPRIQVGYKRELDVLRNELTALTQLVPGYEPEEDSLYWLRRRLVELLELRAELAKRDAVLQPAKQDAVSTQWRAGDTIRYSDQLGRPIVDAVLVQRERDEDDSTWTAKVTVVHREHSTDGDEELTWSVGGNIYPIEGDPRFTKQHDRWIAATARQAIEQFIATVERAHQPGRFDAHCFACSWTTDGNESVVEDAVYKHATEHHVRKPKPAEPCPSLFLQDGRLFTCCVTGGPHTNHISKQDDKGGRYAWRSTDAVPVPWPKSQEPPAGIDILQDTYDDTYLCRETDGWVWWSRLAKRNEYDGEASEWADAAPDADGDLIVIRPDNG